MASSEVEEVEMEELGGLPRDIDYDLEYLVRNRWVLFPYTRAYTVGDVLLYLLADKQSTPRVAQWQSRLVSVVKIACVFKLRSCSLPHSPPSEYCMDSIVYIIILTIPIAWSSCAHKLSIIICMIPGTVLEEMSLVLSSWDI